VDPEVIFCYLEHSKNTRLTDWLLTVRACDVVLACRVRGVAGLLRDGRAASGQLSETVSRAVRSSAVTPSSLPVRLQRRHQRQSPRSRVRPENSGVSKIEPVGVYRAKQ